MTIAIGVRARVMPRPDGVRKSGKRRRHVGQLGTVAKLNGTGVMFALDCGPVVWMRKAFLEVVND